MQRFQGTVQDANGRAVASATVTVYTSGVVNPLPVIYQAAGSKTAPAVQSNPISTDSLGNFGFAAPDGTYDVVISGGGIPTKTLPNINFFDGGITYPSPMLGTVTSVSMTAPALFTVGGSPVTGSGTLVMALATQSKNLVLASDPVNNGVAPAMRSLVAADLPSVGTAGVKGSATKIPVFTTDAQGNVVSNTDTTCTPAFSSITGTPTTLAGYGITDAASLGSAAFFSGDLRWSMDSTVQSGWLLANGGTIGNAASGGTSRAAADTQSLFTIIWNQTLIDYCPMQDSAGAVVSKGATAAADFGANKRIALPTFAGRSMVGVGTGTWAATFTADAGTERITLSRAYKGIQTGQALTLSNVGGALPAGLSAGVWYAIRVSDSVVQLASTLALALAGSATDITGAGTGVHTATLNLTAITDGELGGEATHGLITAEIPAHVHGTVVTAVAAGTTLGAVGTAYDVTTASTASTGGSAAHNLRTPYQGAYCHIKL